MSQFDSYIKELVFENKAKWDGLESDTFDKLKHTVKITNCKGKHL